MANRISKHCPHCGKLYASFSVNASRQRFGSPLRSCEGCRKPFLDRDYTEPAFHGKPRRMTLMQAAQRYLIPYGVIAMLALVVALLVPHIYLRIACGLSVGLYLFLVFYQYSRRHSILHRQQTLYEVSQNRVRDPEYIKRLLDHGCQIPREYLEKHHPALVGYTPGAGDLRECKLRNR